ncbi:MFS transporter [Demetria terragena]|uniref:MFS transporter n=1 Tax=Demetria terragena TaxID=63959 RepID=UPI0003695D01|nr:MFS transporter [Demetria terragena]
MSPLRRYRALFGLTGPAYIFVAFLARIPLAMSQLGVLLLVAEDTGSYGAGGATAGALAIANAIGAMFWGNLADRLGQRTVVLVQSLIAGSGLLAVVFIVHTDLAWGWAAAVAAGAGLFIPQVGPLARARWRPVTSGVGESDTLMDVAFSYEGAADEASFVLGPAIVGVIAATANSTVSVCAAGVLLAVFGSWFALHPTARTAFAARERSTASTASLWTPAIITLSFAQFAIGSVFGSIQNGTNVLATAVGQPGLTGLFHALLGVGSVIAGLSLAYLPTRWSLASRLRWFALAFLLLSLPLLAVGSLAALAPVLFILGLTVAPYMITTFTLAEKLTPMGRTGAAMTLLAGATGLGYAVGAALAGRLADWGGHTPAFAVTVGAGVLMLGTVLIWRHALREPPATASAAPDSALVE